MKNEFKQVSPGNIFRTLVPQQSRYNRWTDTSRFQRH